MELNVGRFLYWLMLTGTTNKINQSLSIIQSNKKIRKFHVLFSYNKRFLLAYAANKVN